MGMQIEAVMEHHFAPIRIAELEKPTHSGYGRGVETRTLLHCQRECEMMQSHWKHGGSFLKS